MKKTAGKKKQIIIILLGVLSTVILMACGKKDPLEGTWKKIDYQIDQDKQEIEYTESEISFADGRMTKGNETLLYELADDGHSIYLENGSGETKKEFDIKNNSLLFDKELYYKFDTDEFNNYKAEIEAQAQTELDELVAQIEAEKALEQAKKEALENAVNSWDDAVDRFVDDYYSSLETVRNNITTEVFDCLEGTWTSTSNPFHTDTYVFHNGEAELTILQLSTRIVEGKINVEFMFPFDFSQIDKNRFSGPSTDIESQLNLLQEAPFDDSWELEELQGADDYIQEKMDYLYAQIKEMESVTLEYCKKHPQMLTVTIPGAVREQNTIEVGSMEESKFIMNEKYEVYKHE